MSKKEIKIAKSYRLDRKTVAQLEQYARDEGITQTEAVERAIKNLCRVGNNPATQQDIVALTEIMRGGFERIQDSIANQPIAALAVPKKRGFIERLFGE